MGASLVQADRRATDTVAADYRSEVAHPGLCADAAVVKVAVDANAARCRRQNLHDAPSACPAASVTAKPAFDRRDSKSQSHRHAVFRCGLRNNGSRAVPRLRWRRGERYKRRQYGAGQLIAQPRNGVSAIGPKREAREHRGERVAVFSQVAQRLPVGGPLCRKCTLASNESVEPHKLAEARFE